MKSIYLLLCHKVIGNLRKIKLLSRMIEFMMGMSNTHTFIYSIIMDEDELFLGLGLLLSLVNFVT